MEKIYKHIIDSKLLIIVNKWQYWDVIYSGRKMSDITKDLQKMKINDPRINHRIILNFVRTEFNWGDDDSKYIYHDEYWEIIRKNEYRIGIETGSGDNFLKNWSISELVKLKKELDNLIKSKKL